MHQNYSSGIWSYLPKEGTVCDAIIELAEELGNSKGSVCCLRAWRIADRERAVKWAAVQVKSKSRNPRKRGGPALSGANDMEIATKVIKDTGGDPMQSSCRLPRRADCANIGKRR